jgi:hypothetical protein
MAYRKFILTLEVHEAQITAGAHLSSLLLGLAHRTCAKEAAGQDLWADGIERSSIMFNPDHFDPQHMVLEATNYSFREER